MSQNALLGIAGAIISMAAILTIYIIPSIGVYDHTVVQGSVSSSTSTAQASTQASSSIETHVSQ